MFVSHQDSLYSISSAIFAGLIQLTMGAWGTARRFGLWVGGADDHSHQIGMALMWVCLLSMMVITQLSWAPEAYLASFEKFLSFSSIARFPPLNTYRVLEQILLSSAALLSSSDKLWESVHVIVIAAILFYIGRNIRIRQMYAMRNQSMCLSQFLFFGGGNFPLGRRSLGRR